MLNYDHQDPTKVANDKKGMEKLKEKKMMKNFLSTLHSLFFHLLLSLIVFVFLPV